MTAEGHQRIALTKKQGPQKTIDVSPLRAGRFVWRYSGQIIIKGGFRSYSTSNYSPWGLLGHRYSIPLAPLTDA